MFCVHQEHLSVALALSLPIVCVITKVDSTPPQVYEQTVKQLVKVLRSPGCRKKPVFVSLSLDDLPLRSEAVLLTSKTSAEPFDVPLPQVNDNGMACELAMGFAAEKACPVFRVSNVTGEGLELLKVGRGSSSSTRLSSSCADSSNPFAVLPQRGPTSSLGRGVSRRRRFRARGRRRLQCPFREPPCFLAPST